MPQTRQTARTRRTRRRASSATPTETLESRSLLTTFTVTSLADNLDDDGEMTLREAIEAANDNNENDTIVFQSGLTGAISLNANLGSLRSNGTGHIEISGNGREQTVIDGSAVSIIFRDQGEGGLTLRAMTLQDAQFTAVRRTGAYGYPTTRIEDALITGSGGPAVSGSFSYSEGGYDVQIEVENSIITDSDGPAISLSGAANASVTNSTLSNNERGVSASFDGYGSPNVLIRNSVIQGNTTLGDGGGVRFTGDRLTIRDSLISGNSARNGGGIFAGSDRTFHLSGSTVSGNVATEDGGGIQLTFTDSGEIQNSTISGNTAVNGGGVHFTQNPGVAVRNSTFTENTALSSGGGAYFTVKPNSPVESNIFARNQATTDGTDLLLESSTNVVFRRNLVGSNRGADLTATGNTPDSDGNLVGTTTSLLDPQLTTLTDVGILKVHLLSPTSPAINRGSNPEALTTDQVGNPRQNGIATDIGAIEVAPTGLVVSNPEITEGNFGTRTLVFTIEAVEDLGGPLTFDVATFDGTATAGSDYTTLTDTLSFSGDSGESQQVTITTNTDTVAEFNETLFLRFSNSSNNQITLPGDAVGTILNDDVANGITLENGVLHIQGTQNADIIEVTLEESFIKVRLNDEAAEFAGGDVESMTVLGENGDDSIIATFVTQPMFIDAGDGNDTVKGGLGDDKILGRDGDDKLRGTQGDDSILGGDGNDSIQGQLGNDTVIGGNGNDTVKGNDGNDFMRGDTGADSMQGGEGDDTMRGGGGNDSMVGENGADRVNGGGGADFQDGGAGDDRAGGGSGADTLVGGDGADYLNAGTGPDQLIGGDGDDTLLGRAGDDILLGEDGDDYIKGLTGRDIAYGGHGADSFFANSDDDILIAGVITPADGMTIVQHLSGTLFDEWRSGRSYADRVENIRNGPNATSNKQNDIYLIAAGRTGQNVFDDNEAEDDVRGGNDSDLFFAKIGSDLLDRNNSEFIEEL
jgi:CSLREA domain-containing protein